MFLGGVVVFRKKNYADIELCEVEVNSDVCHFTCISGDFTFSCFRVISLNKY